MKGGVKGYARLQAETGGRGREIRLDPVRDAMEVLRKSVTPRLLLLHSPHLTGGGGGTRLCRWGDAAWVLQLG